MSRNTALMICFALAGCGAAYTQETKTDLGADITLAPDATASVGGEEVTVRFVGVTEDSRCPVDATCVWEGEVKVQLAVRVSKVDSLLTIREGDSAVESGYRVTLLRVGPRPASTGRIVAADYRATLKIDKG